MSRTVLAFLLIALCACSSNPNQSKTLDELTRDGDGPKVARALYFYPSTLRMLTGIIGDKNGQALDGVEQGRLLFSWNVASDFEGKRKVETLAGQYPKIRKGLKEEGFEVLMQMKRQGAEIDVFMLDRKENPIYVLLINDIANTVIVEVAGEISQQNLMKLSQLNLEKAAEMFDLEQPAMEKDSADTTDTVRLELEI